MYSVQPYAGQISQNRMHIITTTYDPWSPGETAHKYMCDQADGASAEGIICNRTGEEESNPT